MKLRSHSPHEELVQREKRNRLFPVEGSRSIVCCDSCVDLNQKIRLYQLSSDGGRHLEAPAQKTQTKIQVFSGCDGLIVCTGELYPSTHQRLKEIPLKDPLSFKQPRTSRAAFIFKAYPVTKDTSAPRLHYMWSGCKLADVSASLCPSAIHAV